MAKCFSSASVDLLSKDMDRVDAYARKMKAAGLRGAKSEALRVLVLAGLEVLEGKPITYSTAPEGIKL